MLKAKQAREITEEAIKKEIETRSERAKEFCDTIITQEIEKAANNKSSFVTIQNIEKSLYSYIIGILKDNNYSVTMLNSHTIAVNW